MAHENNANDLSTLFAPLLPSGADEVSTFLMDAAFALGCREADLARMIGVSRATLSGWKARGAIPKEHCRWFSEEFPERVIFEFRSVAGEDYRHVGIEVALHLLKISNFNPFGLSGVTESEILHRCYWHFGGITRFCFFVLHRLPLEAGASEKRELEAARIAGALICAAADRSLSRYLSQ